VTESRPRPEPGNEAAPKKRTRTELGLVLGWWTIFGVWLTGQNMLVSASLGSALSLAEAAARGFFGVAVWAGITLLTFRIVRQFRIDTPPRTVPILVTVLAGIVISVGEVVITFASHRAFGWYVDPFVELMVAVFPTNMLYYWLLVGVGHGLEYHRGLRQREAQNERLSRQLAQAQLHLLKSQLHPHFLFNTLHAISALMHRDVKAADRMLARLSQLLRVALDYTGTQEVSLEEELDFLEPYMEIEQVRLGDRLTVDMDVQPQMLEARVPHMILQPLVENAIRHGIAPRVGPGRIVIRAQGRRDMLDLEVWDDGPGLANGKSANGGLGLANTRARLEQLYGESFTFDPSNAPDGGFRVAISIPFRSVLTPLDPEEEFA
jgi:signal transduction histidine kinase